MIKQGFIDSVLIKRFDRSSVSERFVSCLVKEYSGTYHMLKNISRPWTVQPKQIEWRVVERKDKNTNTQPLRTISSTKAAEDSLLARGGLFSSEKLETSEYLSCRAYKNAEKKQTFSSSFFISHRETKYATAKEGLRFETSNSTGEREHQASQTSGSLWATYTNKIHYWKAVRDKTYQLDSKSSNCDQSISKNKYKSSKETTVQMKPLISDHSEPIFVTIILCSLGIALVTIRNRDEAARGRF